MGVAECLVLYLKATSPKIAKKRRDYSTFVEKNNFIQKNLLKCKDHAPGGTLHVLFLFFGIPGGCFAIELGAQAVREEERRAQMSTESQSSNFIPSLSRPPRRETPASPRRPRLVRNVSMRNERQYL